MALSLENIDNAHKLLKEYSGTNSYIIRLKNSVFVYKTKTMNDFEAEYVLYNYDKEPKLINKIVRIPEWYGKKRQEEWETEFVPDRFKITWYMGETNQFYHFYCIYRRSQEKAVEVFAPKRAILTDFLSEDWNLKEIDFKPYNERSGRTLYPYQEEAVKFLTSRKKGILASEMGSGKCEPLSADIPTPNGFVKMGDIKIGDKVFGSDGKAHTVLGVFPQGKKTIYKVSFSDGTFCRCGKEHLWIVKKVKSKKNKPWKVMSLGEILEYGFKNPKNIHENYWKIPICEPVEYKEQKHFIQPYLLGMMIGDGNLCSGGIHISIPDSEKESIERISSLLNDDYELSENRSASCPRYSIVSKNKKCTLNEYNREIKRLNLDVNGNEKFIPNEYKLDSINNRIELLRGLMDSDGSIYGRNKISFSTSSEKLANDVKELVYSLGGRATLHFSTRKNRLNKNGKHPVSYQLNIQIKINPFNLSRKSKKYSPTFVKYCSKYISNIEKDGEENAQCIFVDSDDHSYLTGHDYIVTHNTLAAIIAALEDKYQKILIICPASVKMTWKKELELLVPSDDITIVEGSKWKENRFTIINYDILKNFYEVPTEVVKKKELNLNDDGKIVKVVKEKTVVSRKKAVITEAMDNSQLYQSKFDLVIIDEAHRLSNTTSGIFKIVSDLLGRSNPKGIYAITGTPITNRPINFFNILKIIDAPLANDWKYYVERYCDGRWFYNKKERDAYSAIFCRKKKKNTWYDLTDKEKEELDKILDKNCKKIWVTDGSSNLDELQEVVKPYYLRRLKSDFGKIVKKTVKVLNYKLTNKEREEYDGVWDEYIQAQEGKGKEDIDKYKRITEGIMLRQWLAKSMTKKTIKLAEKCINLGHKVVIFCSFDDELNTIKEHFGKLCVVHNGKLTMKRKNDSVEKFQNDPNIKVFIGNIQSAGVGLTLVASRVAIFNSFSWVSGDNLQAEDRIHRLNQKNDVTIYYQVYSDTFYKEMLEKVRGKQEIIDNIIVSESEK